MSDATVDPGLAAWLKSAALYAVATDPITAARWPVAAMESEYIGPHAFRSDAVAEAAVQLDFMRGPYARDEVVVDGLWSSLIGTTQRINGDRYGYQGGADVFILAARENDTVDLTTLTVLFPLAP